MMSVVSWRTRPGWYLVEPSETDWKDSTLLSVRYDYSTSSCLKKSCSKKSCSKNIGPLCLSQQYEISLQSWTMSVALLKMNISC